MAELLFSGHELLMHHVLLVHHVMGIVWAGTLVRSSDHWWRLVHAVVTHIRRILLRESISKRSILACGEWRWSWTALVWVYLKFTVV